MWDINKLFFPKFFSISTKSIHSSPLGQKMSKKSKSLPCFSHRKEMNESRKGGFRDVR